MNLYDTFVIDDVRRTGDGYLTAFARVARTGIQSYRGYELGRPDLDTVRVYRSPEEVFAPDAMRSFAHRPVTLKHPPKPVNAGNWKKYAGGQTGEDVVRDGDFVRVPLVMMDAAMIDAYDRQGVKELSMGYSTDIKWVTGVTDSGEQYDAVQTAIRANHLALVPQARGGDRLRVGDADFTAEERAALAKKGEARPDGSYPIRNTSDLHNTIALVGKDPGAKPWIIKRARDLGAVSELPDEWNVRDGKKNSITDGMKTCPECGAQVDDSEEVCPECGYEFDDYTQDGEPKMKTIVVDGLNVSVADDQSASIIQKVLDSFTKRLADAEADMEKLKKKKQDGEEEVTDAKKTIETRDGEIAVLKQQLKDAEVTPAKLDTLVKDRLVVIDGAAKVLGKDFAYDGKTLAEIRKAVVETKLGDAAKALSDAAVEGAFAAIIADGKSDGGTRSIADAVANRRPGGASSTNAADTAYAESAKSLQDAWKSKSAA